MSDQLDTEVERCRFTIGGWGYNADHPEKWHVVDGDVSVCGAMSELVNDGVHGTFDWVRCVRSADWADRVTFGEMCGNCKRAGGFNAVR